MIILKSVISAVLSSKNSKVCCGCETEFYSLKYGRNEKEESKVFKSRKDKIGLNIYDYDDNLSDKESEMIDKHIESQINFPARDNSDKESDMIDRHFQSQIIESRGKRGGHHHYGNGEKHRGKRGGIS